MVKQSMKLHSGDKALYRVLDARQLGLKLIANVTYGYTSANFSGRMACVEVSLRTENPVPSFVALESSQEYEKRGELGMMRTL